jgi:hypothetical protein
VAFDRLLARLFRTDPAPWVLKGGYALELRFKTARATIDIDLTVQRIAAATETDSNLIVRDMLQDAASFPLGDWFEYTVGPPVLDLDAAPYGGARFPVETRVDGRILARFHLDAGIGDAVIQPVEIIACPRLAEFRLHRRSTGPDDFAGAAVCRKTARLYAAQKFRQQPCERSH